MKKLNLKEILSPAFALFLICLISAFLLAGTNALTSQKIEKNTAQAAIESRKLVFATATSFTDEKTVIVNNKNVSYVRAVSAEGLAVGYVFTSTSKGYGGDVTVMTGITVNGEIAKSVVLSMSDETPGLGQNAGKNDFLDKFIGKSGPFTWSKNSISENEITGVTSATFTSKAVIECVNDAITAFKSIGGDR